MWDGQHYKRGWTFRLNLKTKLLLRKSGIWHKATKLKSLMKTEFTHTNVLISKLAYQHRSTVNPLFYMLYSFWTYKMMALRNFLSCLFSILCPLSYQFLPLFCYLYTLVYSIFFFSSLQYVLWVLDFPDPLSS